MMRSQSFHPLKLAILTGAPLILLALLLVLRHRYTATPQYAFWQFRAAMANLDFQQLEQYTTPRTYAALRQNLVQAHRQAPPGHADVDQLLRANAQRRNADFRRFGVRWKYTDATHVTATCVFVNTPVPQFSAAPWTTTVSYDLVNNGVGWAVDSEPTSSVL